MKGTWETASGGSGTVVYAVAAAVVCGFAAAAALAVSRAVASIPAYVWPLAAAAMVTGLIVSVWFLARSNRRQAAAFTARCEKRRAVEAAEAEDRRRHRLEVAAASAPVIHNWIVPEQIAAARERGFTPTTVFTGQKEIPQRGA